MTFTPHNVRSDSPCNENEIEIAPGNLAHEPVRIAKSTAVPALAAAAAELESFDREAAERRAELERQRAAAVATQSQFTELTTERDNLPTRIAHAKRELETCLSRMAFLDSYCAEHWEAGRPLHDHITEYVRQKFLADRIPSYIDKFRARLVALDEEIAAFKQAHGVQ